MSSISLHLNSTSVECGGPASSTVIGTTNVCIAGMRLLLVSDSDWHVARPVAVVVIVLSLLMVSAVVYMCLGIMGFSGLWFSTVSYSVCVHSI